MKTTHLDNNMATLESLQQQINTMNQFWGNLKSQIDRDMKTAMSSGGGAGSIVQLEMPVRTVTASTAIGRHDYYLGVNSTTSQITITLPVGSGYPGRTIVIKDETGNAQSIPIKISGIIDNNPDGVELRINNGSLTLIYNRGWRII
jgi:hypothetical protein